LNSHWIVMDITRMLHQLQGMNEKPCPWQRKKDAIRLRRKQLTPRKQRIGFYGPVMLPPYASGIGGATFWSNSMDSLFCFSATQWFQFMFHFPIEATSFWLRVGLEFNQKGAAVGF
jgi:hypothetical protein